MPILDGPSDGVNVSPSSEQTESGPSARVREMPMCFSCHRPLGLYYAECLTCLGNADLHGTYYDQWCEWQKAQCPSTPEAHRPGPTA